MGDYGLAKGSVAWSVAGPITFGPDGILFVAENAEAKIFAIDVADTGAAAGEDPFELEDAKARVASFLGCAPDGIVLRDLAVHPRSHNIYLSVQRGFGDAAQPVLVRIDHLDGSIAEVSLENVAYSETSIADAPSPDDERLDMKIPQRGDENEAQEVTFGDLTFSILRLPIRSSTITDMAYEDGALFVAGLSNEEFSSKLRRIPFPFGGSVLDNNLEIFHVSHGKWETAAPIRTFVPYEQGRSILASYTCTPVVHFPLEDLQPGTKTIGRTVAELGSRNQPLDMVRFVQDGAEHLLVANTAHGLIKISCSDIAAQEPLTVPQEPIGVPHETEDLQGIVRLANLGETHVLALQDADEGRQHLRSLKNASL